MSKSRSVIVTGAGSGIGASIAKAFAEAGDRIYLADLSAERLEATAAQLDTDRASTHVVDVTDTSAVEGLVQDVVTETGSLDIVISNAGVFDACASILDTTHELWEKIIGINLTGTFNVVKAAAEPMATQRSGRIIVVGSIAGQRALPDGLAYCTSKAALEGMVRRLAFDLGPYGVTANVIAPGVIRTSIRATSQEILGDAVPDTNVGVGASSDLMDMLIPLKRGGDPSEIAATAVFLASEGAAYISGDVIHVDGGWIAT